MRVRFFLPCLLLVLGTADAAEMLLYSIKEPGAGAYPSRMIVTDDYVRMDDGADGGDFVLMERRSGAVHSVTHGDRTVLTIPARPVTIEPPVELHLTSEAVPLGEEAPTIGGRQAVHHRLQVNGSDCYNVVAVPGLLPESVAATLQFRRTLAGQHARTLLRTPADMHKACELAVDTFHPEWALGFGLPIQEWSGDDQRGRALMDFDPQFEAKPSLFELPSDYERLSVGE